MEWEGHTVDRRDRWTPVLVEAGSEATVGQLRAALPELAGPEPLYLGHRPVGDEEPLARIGLGAGAALRAGAPCAPAPTTGRDQPGWELAVAGGLAAGSMAPLAPSAALTVGRGRGCGLALPDPEVSRLHAEIRLVEAGAQITDAGSRNGTVRRGHRIAAPAELADGDVFRVGETILGVRVPAPADARLTRDGSGVAWFNRPPRILPPERGVEVSIPAEPPPPQGFRFPLATVLLPLLAAAVCLAVLPGSAYFLIFLALSPLMVVANLVSDRRSGRKDYRSALRAYQQELAQARDQLAALAAAEELAVRALLPDPAALARVATGPTGRLFERRPGDPDFLRLRVGLTDRSVGARLVGPGAAAEEPPLVYAVPVSVDLPAVGVLGLAGARDAVLAMARAVLVQAATLHAPHDLGIAVLAGDDRAADWEWVSWLPHTVPHRPDLACRRLFGTGREQAQARVAELRRLVAERREEQAVGLRDRVPNGRRMLLVLDGARRLRDLPGLADLLAEGPAAGVYALCLDDAAGSLPDECRATVEAVAPTRVRLTRPGGPPEEGVLADGTTVDIARRVALALAPVRVLGARLGADDGLPDAVRYLELAGLGADPTPAAVAAGWAAQPGGRGTRALLGVGATGPVEVDLRRDGPHALVAGTSGAGKSELLQALVAGLALTNAPDALNVVLVDYKGGSAFADCRDLPHCVGLVTDLDGHLVRRALASLSAELRRREAILAGASAKDIEDYWALTGGRLPRLVIVVDEFASLVEEVPEFVPGVVGIGARGRSLGIHVVLATQRPGGVVNAELRANVNLRVCLRVTSAAESTDVIDAPDAARVSRHHPGRGFVRTGHSDLAVFQAARIGWPRSSTVDAAEPVVRAWPRRVSALGRPRSAPAGAAGGPGAYGTGTVRGADGPGGAGIAGGPGGHGETDGVTDLTALVAAVRAAAEEAGVAAPPGPWLPPLPTELTLAGLEAGDTGSPAAVPIGLADEPARQAQRPYVLDLAAAGAVAVAGMARSGRSTLLRTLAAALAERSSPLDVHLYVLDYGSRALAPLRALPHCGAYVDADEPERVERLLGLLTAEVGRRRRVLAAGSHSSIREQRSAVAESDRLPYVVLLLDQYEAFLARHSDVDGGRLVDVVDGLLRNGPAVGVLAVLSTDRSGFGHRLASAVATRLVLRQADPEQAAVYGLEPRSLPRAMPPGRLVTVPAETEVQVALLDPDPGGAAQAAAVERLVDALARRWDGADRRRLPHRVDPLPEVIQLAEVAALRPAAGPGARAGDRAGATAGAAAGARAIPGAAPAVCTVGVGGDHLAPVDLDLAEAGATFLVSGPPRAGRSGALAALVTSLAGRASGVLPVVLLCPRPSPLRDLRGLSGVADVLFGRDVAEDLTDLLAELPGPAAVVVDDAELLADEPVAAVLEGLARDARDEGGLVIAAGTTEDLQAMRFRGWPAALRRARAGLLLNPAGPTDGEVFEARLPRSTCGGWPPGRGLLVWRGALTPVQVPMVDLVAVGG